MWVALFTIWLYRAVFYSPPPGRLVATLWINIAPPSVIPLSYEALLGMSPTKVHMLEHLYGAIAYSLYGLFYYSFWGAAGLLFILVFVITAGYAIRREVEFADSWWAFVFPLAAYSISTIHLYWSIDHEKWLLDYAVLLYMLAWLSYIVTTALSLRAAVRRYRKEEA